MRIIAGQYKSRKIKNLDGEEVRPTLDRVKESVFNIIGPDISGARILDLFAGSGNLGLEALSRGAVFACFVEKNKRCQRVLLDNIKHLNVSTDSYFIEDNVFFILEKLYNGGEKFDFIFADPPYLELVKGEKDRLLVECFLDLINKYCLLAPEGILIVEHFKEVSLASEMENIFCFRKKKYGIVNVSFYKRR